MSHFNDEIERDFAALLLDAFVPLAVQAKIPRVREHWSQILARGEGAEALRACVKRMSSTRRSVGESIRLGISTGDEHVTCLKGLLYKTIGQDQELIRHYFQRPVTNGNEQCPYWDNMKYTNEPR
jgi:hypothetical protein